MKTRIINETVNNKKKWLIHVHAIYTTQSKDVNLLERTLSNQYVSQIRIKLVALKKCILSLDTL